MTCAGSDILAFDTVTFAYPPGIRPVLRDFSLTVETGTTTVILGPNGHGKSTLLNLALGWLRPTTGRVLFDGTPLERYSRRQLGRHIAVVPQSERIPFDYTVTDYVLLARAPHIATLSMPGPADEKIAWQAITTVGLDRLRHRKITTLSGGERQLATIARALAQRPRLLLLDEPTAHLDLAHKTHLISFIQKLITDGLTIMITTHEPEIAAAIATHLVLIRHGRVRQAGTRADTFTAANLSATYGIPVDIARVQDREVVLWT